MASSTIPALAATTTTAETSAGGDLTTNNSSNNNNNNGSSLYYPTSYANYAPASYPASVTRHRFAADLSQCLFDFVIQLLPTAEEISVKEDVRKLLERLIRTIEPNSKLLSFGSTANGFSLRNSDMDLCCLIDSTDRLSATDLVTMVGDLLERETKFHVKPLPHARIPIVKLSLDPSPGLPCGIACDIGFENRLALENTRLLMCYAMIDPTRVRTMVLFLKVWSKRRKINSPYKGTLSSYGYVLMVIYFLVHVKNPPVLPNLQTLPPMRPISKEETHVGPHNTWFFDDIDLLRQHWHSDNTETVAELLIEFFRYYSKDFPYSAGVLSIRAGILKKESKGWQSETRGSRYGDGRERNRFCIEDPFETDFNVARCVTKDGLYTIRGEFMRALRILQARPERAILALAELCEERPGEDLVAAPSYPPPRPPPQTPYTVGSKPLRNKSANVERLSPPTAALQSPSAPHEPKPSPAAQKVFRPPPPEHMAPKRGKWTSPPPPEAPPSAHALFEDQFGHALELATANTDARESERNRSEEESSNSSEILTDIDDELRSEDDVRSIRSYTEGVETGLESPVPASSSNQRRPSWLTATPPMHTPMYGYYPSSDSKAYAYVHSRGNRFYRPTLQQGSPTALPRAPVFVQSGLPSSSVGGAPPPPPHSKRSSSGPPRMLLNGSAPTAGMAMTTVALETPLPPSPESELLEGSSADQGSRSLPKGSTSQSQPTSQQRPSPNTTPSPSTVFYQTSTSPTLKTGLSPRAMPVLYPPQNQQQPTQPQQTGSHSHSSPSSASPILLQYQQQQLQQQLQLLQQQQYHLISSTHPNAVPMKDDVLAGVPGLTVHRPPNGSSSSRQPIYTPMPLQHHHLHSPEHHRHVQMNNNGVEMGYVDVEGLDAGVSSGPETPTPMNVNVNHYEYVRGSGGPGGASGGVSLGSPSSSPGSSTGKRRGARKSSRSNSPLLPGGGGGGGSGGNGNGNGRSPKPGKGGGSPKGGNVVPVVRPPSGSRGSSGLQQQQVWQGPPPSEAESSRRSGDDMVLSSTNGKVSNGPALSSSIPSPLNLGSSSNRASSSPSSSSISLPKRYDLPHSSPSRNTFVTISSGASNSSSPSPPLLRASSSPSSSSVLSRRSSLQEVDDMEWPRTPPVTATPANYRGQNGLTIYEEDEEGEREALVEARQDGETITKGSETGKSTVVITREERNGEIESLGQTKVAKAGQ